MASLSYNKITIKAGAEMDQSVSGRMLKVISSTGEFYLRMNYGDTMGPLNDCDIENNPFDGITFINKTGSDIVLKYFYGDGSVRTNSISFAGVMDLGVDIENDGANDMLMVKDKQLVNVIDALENQSNALGTNRNSAQNVGAVAVVLIDPAVNVSGVLIKTLNAQTASGDAGALYIDTTAPSSWADATKYKFCAFEVGRTYTLPASLKIPAGQGLYAICSSATANNFASVSYEVL